MKIAILSRRGSIYSTSRIKQAGLERGHYVRVIDHMHCNLIMEQGQPQIMYHGNLLPRFDAIVPRIGSSVTYYGAAVIRQFEMMNIFSAVPSASLLKSRDKLQSLQELSKAGLGLPKTVFTNFSKSAEEVVRLAGGVPLIIKLLEGTQGLGVILAEKKSAAVSVIEAFYGLQAKVIVQEFIEEAKGSDVRAFVVGGSIVAAMKRTAAEGEFRSNFHRGGSCEEVQLTEPEKKAAILAARTMGLGIAGVDMLRSKRGPLILEINSSPGLEGIEGATKKDIGSSIIKYLEHSLSLRNTRINWKNYEGGS